VVRNRKKVNIKKILRKEQYPVTKVKHATDIILGKNNHFLIGEAAGLVMPITYEGISLAYESASHLATALLDKKDNKNERYNELMQTSVHRIISSIQW